MRNPLNAPNFLRFVDNIPGMVYRYSKDVAQTNLFVSEGVFSLTGYRASDFASGKVNYRKLIHSEDQQSVTRQIEATLCAGKPAQLLYRISTRSRETKLVLENSRRVVTSNQKQVSLEGIVLEVTCLEQFIEQLAKELNKTELSKQSHRSFAETMHDLFEPMRTISTHCQLLLDRHASQFDEGGRELAGRIWDASRRMIALIRDLREHPLGTVSHTVESCESQEVITQVLASLKPLIEESGAKIELKNLLRVNANVVGLGRIFQNLICNAIRFKKEHSVPHITIGSDKTKEGCRFFVKDNGVGIALDVQKRLFSGSSTERISEQRNRGSGYGLGICKRIIELHGGKIWVESVPGKGSTFFFTLPQS
ncbi:MAG: PAS domain-containing protein [Deltaproteobacteria bacterium]|nr:PAS domain-containing protein [Deltaproteobacteria bacterium]